MSVVNFAAAKNRKRQNIGEDGIMTCSCQIQEDRPMGFLPVLVHDQHNAIISGIACAACGWGYEVRNGRLIEEPTP